MPHSVLACPAHRPERASFWSSTFDVHGMQPMEK
jgi:hypothetical protein